MDAETPRVYYARRTSLAFILFMFLVAFAMACELGPRQSPELFPSSNLSWTWTWDVIAADIGSASCSCGRVTKLIVNQIISANAWQNTVCSETTLFTVNVAVVPFLLGTLLYPSWQIQFLNSVQGQSSLSSRTPTHRTLLRRDCSLLLSCCSIG